MTFIQEINKIIHSDHPFVVLFKDTLNGISYLWNYQLFKADGQPIAVSNVIIGLILFLFGLRYAKQFSLFVRNKLSAKAKLDNHSANSVEHLSYYIFILITAFFVLEITNVPLTTLTVVGTTLALGIGLGSQNIANNFISGLIIMIEKPIKLGDTIEVKNVIGKVTHIGSRCVSLQTEDNINMLIPNSNILQDYIINWTLNDPTIKMILPIFVENNCSISEVDKLLYQVMDRDPNILKFPAPKIILHEICEECLVFEMEFWINLEGEINRKDIVNGINREIAPLFRAHNIKVSDGPENKDKRKIKYLTSQFAKLH